MSLNPMPLFPGHASRGDSAATDRGFPPERRKRVRTRLHWPLMLFRDPSSQPVESLTQNLSSNGFYCVSPTSFMPGEWLHCAMKIPVHHPAAASRVVSLECTVRVVRAEPASEPGFFGIACRIEDYRLATA